MRSLTMYFFLGFCLGLDIDWLAVGHSQKKENWFAKAKSAVFSHFLSISLPDTPCVNQVKAMLLDPASQQTAMTNMLLYSGKGLGELGDYNGCARAGSRHILLSIQITPGIPQTIGMGFCAPINCTETELNTLLRKPLVGLLPDLLPLMEIPLYGRYWVEDTSVEFIDTKYRESYLSKISIWGWVFIIFTGVFIIIQVAASIYQGSKDPNFEEEPKTTKEMLFASLSIVRNAKALVYGDVSTDPALNTFFGIQALMMVWLNSAHVCYYYSVTPTTNMIDQNEEIKDNPMLQISIASEHAVDILFFASGFLCVMILSPLLKESEGLPIKNIIILILRRYTKYILVYCAIILFGIAILPFLYSNSPINAMNEWIKNGCEKMWYSNLLYINNFMACTYGCLQWAWYWAAEFQFFIVAPFIIYAYHHSKKVAILIVGLILLGSIISQAYIITYYDMSYSYLRARENQYDEYNVRPYTRCGPYLIGMIMAWMYQSFTLNGEYTIVFINSFITKWMESRTLRYILYFVGVVLSLGNFVITYVFDHYPEKINLMHNISYLIFGRLRFALGALLIVLPVLLGKSRVLRAILSAKFWGIFSKATMVAFLINNMLCIADRTSEMHAGYLYNFRVFIMTFHMCVLTFVVSCFFCLVYEAPTSWLTHYFFCPTISEKIYPSTLKDIPRY